MNPIVIILVFGLGSTLIFSIILATLKVKVAGSIAIALAVSDVIIGLIHQLDFNKGYYIPSDGDTTLFIYWIISLVYFIIYIIVHSIKYRSNTCVCNCCKHQDYFNLDEQSLWDKLI
jgi:hypothetical protein